LFFVPRDTQGVTVTPLDKLGMRALNSCSIRLDRVFVPDDLLLGEADKAWKEVTQTLNAERIIESAMCLGMIDGVLEDAIAYMTQRRAFGRLIGEFQALQHYVADMAMWQKQSELMLRHTASLQSREKPCAMEAAMTKTLTSEYACQAADLGISILGGMGYSAETDMQRYWRDARLLRIGPVSNEMARNMMRSAGPTTPAAASIARRAGESRRALLEKCRDALTALGRRTSRGNRAALAGELRLEGRLCLRQ
jgi:alkylation response protein AidB-like acyl-CoA dehydrogenase